MLIVFVTKTSSVWMMHHRVVILVIVVVVFRKVLGVPNMGAHVVAVLQVIVV